MSLRTNKLLMTVGGICCVILVVEVVLLVIQGVRLSAARKGYAALCRSRERLVQRDPYPSAGNVRRVEEHLDDLSYYIGELAGELNGDPFPAEAIEAAEFSARTQGVIERFRKKAVQAGVELPEKFEVGFSRYASGGAVPEMDYVLRLTRQLYSVERVADVLVQSGVHSITAMTRDVFEVADPDTPRRRRSRNLPAARKLTQESAASWTGPGGLYYVEQIRVTFTADEKGVWRVLQGFSRAPHFMRISAFGHRTLTDIMQYSPTAVKRGGESDDEALKYLAEGILSGENALSRPERIIAGNDRVAVELAVDVYHFNPEGMDE
ncbi:hypothetical protein EGM51_15380 [Verrucomicrobia bacterium S94]|nr:hypothetical protein EGM51_15380 [Verrucomicrobia bacterium S94]